MVITTTGRKSGQPRRTAIEFHEFKGRNYVFSDWGQKADWLQNIHANPLVTIQTRRGAQSVTPRQMITNAVLAEAFEYSMSNPSMRTVLKSVGFELTLDQFIAQKERFIFVTFEQVDEPTPPESGFSLGVGGFATSLRIARMGIMVISRFFLF